MRPKYYDFDPIDVDADGIAESQTTGAAASLTLDGVLADLGTAGEFEVSSAGYSAGIGGVRIGFTSAGDISGVVFAITGLDQDGVAQTENVTGPNATITESTKYWSKITDIASDGAVGSAVTVGPVDEFLSKTIPINWRATEAFLVVVHSLAGTCQFDIQESFTDPAAGSANMVWADAQANKTADLSALLTLHARAVRVRMDSYSSGAEFQFGIIGN